MAKKPVTRTKWVNIRLTPAEFKTIQHAYKKTKFRKISEYIRDVILEKDITLIYRDQSMDDMLEELIQLRKELNAVGVNFNQAVKKLNSVAGAPDTHLWQSMLTVLRDKLEPSIRQIKDHIHSYADLWSQKSLAEKA
ncbi:MAG: hypothetical protein JWN56_987 [Sphingobacteriales bacterium]|nr:hypothetical protein [Sphingobacteriales bacterium]